MGPPKKKLHNPGSQPVGRQPCQCNSMLPMGSIPVHCIHEHTPQYNQQTFKHILTSDEFNTLLQEKDQSWISTEANSQDWLDRVATSKFKWFHAQIAKILWNSKEKTFISVPMLRDELTHLTSIFTAQCPFKWEAPIGHLNPRCADYHSLGDACLRGGGGFSIPLTFWWQLIWPLSLQLRTLLNLKKKDPALLSINLFEYVSITVNLAACIEAIGQIHNKNSPPDPVVQIWTDNTTSTSWTRKMSNGTGTTNKKCWSTNLRLFTTNLM